LIFNLLFALIGALVTIGSLYSWALEPVDDPDAGHDDHDDSSDAAHDDHEDRAADHGDSNEATP